MFGKVRAIVDRAKDSRRVPDLRTTVWGDKQAGPPTVSEKNELSYKSAKSNPGRSPGMPGALPVNPPPPKGM